MAESEITFDDKITHKLREIQNKISQIKNGNDTFLKILSMIVVKDVDQHFKDESGPSGKWKTWSPSYRDQLLKAGRKLSGNKNKIRKLLQASGNMRNALTPKNYRRTFQGAEWFNTMKYSRTHDLGDDSRNIPQRQFMWLSEEGLKNLSDQMLRFALSEEK